MSKGNWGVSSGAIHHTPANSPAMSAKIGTIPTPPASVDSTSTLIQALSWLISMAGYVDNADRLDGQHGTYYTNAGNLNAGTLPLARLVAALSAIGNLTPAANKLPYYTGASSAGLASFSAFGIGWIGQSSASDAKSSLALSYSDVSGTSPASLSSIGALTPAANKLPYYTGSSRAALATFSNFGIGWVGLADSTAAKNALAITYSDVGGTVPPSNLTQVITQPQHTNNTTPASCNFVLNHANSFKSYYITSSSDEDVSVSYSAFANTLIKPKGKLTRVLMPEALNASGSYQQGESVTISTDSANIFIVDFSQASSAASAYIGDSSKWGSLILPGGNGSSFRMMSYSGNLWHFMASCKDAFARYALSGGVSNESQCAFYSVKMPDTYNPNSSIEVEIVGGGCRSTISGYIGRSGAYASASIAGAISPGGCINVFAGSNSQSSAGSDSYIFTPAGQYIKAPGGGGGDSVACTTSISSSSMVNYSQRPTSKSTNSASDYGSQGSPIGGPGQRPDLRSGYGGGGAIFDGTGSGQYGAGAGAVLISATIQFPKSKAILSIGCNGSNGSTSFYDFSQTAATISRIGSAQHSSAVKFGGLINSIYLNGGALSIPPVDFRLYSYSHIAVQWYYSGGNGQTAIINTMTSANPASDLNGFQLIYDPVTGTMYIFNSWWGGNFLQYYISSSSLLNKFNLVELEIVPGTARAFFRLWVNKSIASFYMVPIEMITPTNSFIVGKSQAGEVCSDYIIGPSIMVRL